MGVGKKLSEEINFGLVGEIIIYVEICKNVINNSIREKILTLIKENKMTILDLNKKLGLSYRATHRHVEYLAELGLIRRDIRNDLKHNPVFLFRQNDDLLDKARELYPFIKTNIKRL